MAWGEFALALVTFLFSHVLPVRPPIRARAVARLGQRGFTFAYSLLSLALLAWLIAAAGRAPHLPLWTWAPWQNFMVLAAMLPVCLILALSLGRPNPFSFGGARNAQFDPTQPGIVGWIRHPLLVALALWAGAHILANGDLAHVILFGTFGGFALLGQQLIDRRKRRLMGARWGRLRAEMAARPRPSARQIASGAPMRVAAGFSLYAGLIALHPFLFGISPLP